jgi:hypothetical protein
LILYYVLRFAAGRCAGAGCDWFIPLSLLLPLLILIFVAITGLRAYFDAAGRAGERRWALTLGVLTAIGLLGPLVSLFLLRDNPDLFVPIATLLTALVPIAALVYTSRLSPR